MRLTHLGVHYPEIHHWNLRYDRRRSGEDAKKNRGLLRHHERREGQGRNDTEIFASLIDEHYQRESIHKTP